MGEYIPSCRVGFEMGNELLFAIEGSVDGDAMLSTRIEGDWIESFDEDSFAGRIAAKEAPSSLYSSPRRMVGSPKTTASAVGSNNSSDGDERSSFFVLRTVWN